MVFLSASKWQRYLFACFVLASCLSATYGGPIDAPRERALIARQATTTTTGLQVFATQTTSRTATSAETTSSTVTSTASVTTTTASTTSSSQQTTTTSTTSTSSSSTTATSTTSQSTSSSSTSTSTTSSASATATSSSSSILSKSSPYFGYAVGVLVVICLFGFLLIVLVIRFIVQKFSKKPEPQPTTSNAGQWRYSQDTELYSPGTMRNNSVNVAALGARHKDIGSEMGEREAFLSTESVALYPPAKEHDRYTDDDPTVRRHSRSLSNASQSTATPYVSRRPTSMSFLNSPPATHPAFVVDHGSQSGHGHEDEHALRAVPEAPQETNEGLGPRSMPSLLMARASHSDPYRQQTLGSAIVSRAASTASAYSQPSAIRAGTPPFPVLLSAYTQPQPEVSADMSAALSTMQAQNPSTDTIHTEEFNTTAPRTSEGHSGEQTSTLRQTPGRMGWGGQAPTSIHSHADLFFDHSHSR